MSEIKTLNGFPLADTTAREGVRKLTEEIVAHTPQELTDEQKAQARANIGAGTVDEVIAALSDGSKSTFVEGNLLEGLEYIEDNHVINQNGYVDESKVDVTEKNPVVYDYLPAHEGEKYRAYCSFPTKKDSNGNWVTIATGAKSLPWFRVYAYDKNYAPISEVVYHAEPNGKTEQSAEAEGVTPAGTAYIRASFRTIDGSGVISLEMLEGVTIEDGTGSGRLLPAVTEEDNGKTMKVVDGEWVAEFTSGSAAGVPDYWQDAVNVTIETVKAKQDAGGRDCVTFAFFADSHVRPNATTPNAGYTGVLAKAVMDACGIPFAIACGDTARNDGNSLATEAEMRESLAAAYANFAPIGWNRFLQTMGNHDGCWGFNADLADPYFCYQMDAKELYNTMFRRSKDVPGIVFGGDGSYCYVDDTPSKTRFVMLNSHWVKDSYTSEGYVVYSRMHTFGFGQEQLSWFAEKALKFEEDGWGVVIAFHAPIPETNGTYRDDDVLIGILDSYVNGTSNSYSYGTIGAWDRVNVSVDYVDACRAEVIGVFCGHWHKDTLNTDSYSFPVITITSDSNMLPADTDEAPRTYGTDNEHAMDFVTINRVTKKVDLTRLGSGSNREYYYGEAEQEVVNYTNAIQTAQDFTTSGVYNVIGYKNDTTIGSDGLPYEREGYVSTGLIDYVVNSKTALELPIYFKGDIDPYADSFCSMMLYDNEKGFKHSLAKPFVTEHSTYTLTELGTKYYRLNFTPNDAGTNTYMAFCGFSSAKIAFSFKGTGDGLIISVGVPID